jgi:hypothetical protein
VLSASSTQLLKCIVEQPLHEFAMKDLGPLDYFLGIQVW